MHDAECCKAASERHSDCPSGECLRCFMCLRAFFYRSAQREGWAELWPEWVKRWGKNGAADALLASMCETEARYRALKLMLKRKRHARAQKRR